MAKNSIARPDRAKSRARNAAADFSAFDGKKIAMLLQQGEQQFVFRGTAQLARDDKLGIVLKIVAFDQEPGEPKLIVSEQAWNGRIIPDIEHGCDFCMIPG